MRQRSQPQLNEQISEEAAEWLIEFRSGDVDAEGRRAFERWVRSSPEHVREYLKHAAVWNEGSVLDPRREIDVEALIAAAQSEDNVIALAESTEQTVLRRQAPSRRHSMAIAAALLAAVGITATLAYMWTHREPVYVTAAGEQRSIRLSDGSRVDLNSRSRIRVRFDNAGLRRVDLLEGQALFDVARDSARPFVVYGGATRVRALGTQFDVNRKSSGMVVTVLEGKVEVSGDAIPAAPFVTAREVKPIFLSAGQQLSVNVHAAPRPTSADLAAVTAWKQHQVVVNAVPLTEVTEEFNRYSERKLIAQDRAREKLLLSGVFTTDPDFLLRYLRARGDVTVTETLTEVRIVHTERP